MDLLTSSVRILLNLLFKLWMDRLEIQKEYHIIFIILCCIVHLWWFIRSWMGLTSVWMLQKNGQACLWKRVQRMRRKAIRWWADLYGKIRSSTRSWWRRKTQLWTGKYGRGDRLFCQSMWIRLWGSIMGKLMCVVRSQRGKLGISLESLRLQEKWPNILEQNKFLRGCSFFDKIRNFCKPLITESVFCCCSWFFWWDEICWP